MKDVYFHLVGGKERRYRVWTLPIPIRGNISRKIKKKIVKRKAKRKK